MAAVANLIKNAAFSDASVAAWPLCSPQSKMCLFFGSSRPGSLVFLSMDESHSLLLNEEALRQCPDAKKPVFLYEWLRYLDRILPVTQRADLKSIQPQLVQQLLSRLTSANGPPIRYLLARCLARIYMIGDSSTFGDTLNLCNDTLKIKDDSPSQLPAKLAVLACIAAFYETMGRCGSSFVDTFPIMVKWLKVAESQGRAEILITLSSMVTGLGSGAANFHKDVYKAAKAHLADRVMPVRTAALQCVTALVPVYPPLYSTELEAVVTLCTKALDGSNYEARLAVAKLLGVLLATALQPPPPPIAVGKPTANARTGPIRPIPLEDALHLLAGGFLRGGIGGFLKGGSNCSTATVGGQKDVRAGIAMGYVEFMREMGATWLERNLAVVCRHFLELAAKCGGIAYTNSPAQAAEAIFLRRCVSYILRATVGTMLSEQAQITACKYLGQLLADYINSFDYSVEPGVERILGAEAYSSAQAAVVATLELSNLVRQIGTAVTPLFVEASGIMEPVFACLLHPIVSARTATAWCLRCITMAVPSQLTPLIDRCISRLEHMKSCSDAISGYSLALAALIAAASDCKLGIPHAKPKQVLTCAEDMLKTATQQSRLAVAKISAGYILLNAVVSMGTPVVKENMPRIIQLWRTAFPRSTKEAEAEKGRGDAFSWQCALEQRAGALGVMLSVANQRELADDEAIKAMLLPIECALVMSSQVGTLIRSYGTKMRALISCVRVRVYQLLMLLPPKSYEHMFHSLLRELVAEITLSDDQGSQMMTTVAGLLCSGAEHTLLAPWSGGATDQALVEDQVFPMIPDRQKLQITEHFADVIKNCKQAQRQQAIMLNVLCALALAFRGVSESRGGARMDSEPLRKASTALVESVLETGTTPLVRAVAAEALGRLSQAVGDPQFVALRAQACFDKLRAFRDGRRAGYALALGCIHRHVGSLGSGQHLHTGVSVLFALARDHNAPSVQAWAMVALSLIAETGGGMFRGYVELALSDCLTLLLNTQSSNVEVVQGIGKLLTALMTCVGPELGSCGTIEGVRASLLAACAIQLAHPDPLIKSEAIGGLQQMHLYAPRYVNLGHLVVDIATFLTSQHLCLRKASVCCLRQLVQREAREVREHAQVLVPQGVVDEGKKLPLPDTGLEGALFDMLDVETDPTLRAHVQETIISLVQATCSELLNQWLLLCKDILATSNDNTRSTMFVGEEKAGKEGDEDEEGGDDDDATLQVGGSRSAVPDKGKVQPRWPTRVFATQVVQRLMSVCDTERAHLDLSLAKELQMSSGGRADYLVLHLSDLVRMSFMGATSDNTELRLAGLNSLQDVITRFSTVPEPEFPGHVILEQFQAQVGAALRPAFTEDTPSHVTAAACQVCSTWIGSGVARDLNDLRRVHQLLVSSLGKLKHGSINTQLYSESAATLEKLSILKAWAEVYVTAIAQEEHKQNRKESSGDDDDMGYMNSSESLLSLVRPELDSLVCYWLAALRDSALLSLPAQFSDQMPASGGAFYKAESADACREYYRTSWPPILLALAIWLSKSNFELPENAEAPQTWPDNRRESRFHLMMGIAVEALCSRTTYADDPTIQSCLRAVHALLQCEWCQLQLMSDIRLPIELCNVLHRLILTRDNLATQQLCVDCAHAILDAARCSIRINASEDIENGNLPSPITNSDDRPRNLYSGGEGDDGIAQGTTLTFAMMELCLCVMVRQMPQINSAQMKSKSLAPLHMRRFGRLPVESANLIRSGIQLLVNVSTGIGWWEKVSIKCLCQVPSLCSSNGRLIILPSILYLIIGFIRESARVDENSVVPDLPPGHLTTVATTALQALRNLASAPPTDATLSSWVTMMQSALYSILLLCDGEYRKDECVLMLSCVVLASVAPRQVVLGHRESFHRLVRLIRGQLNSEHPQIVSKTLQSLSSLFARRDINGPFISSLGRDVFNVVRPLVTGDDVLTKVKDISEEQLPVVQDAFKALEVLVTVADEKRKFSLVSLLTQSLCRLLCATTADEWRLLSQPARRVHEFAMQRLNAVAPAWPAEFKQVLASHPTLKKRLENALLFQSSRQVQAQQVAKAKAVAETKTVHLSQQPTIKLTMDFNAFGKAAS
ncbi:hypothetical protein Y032_0303g1878 [Ancylostoma ceylanicum]|uniref:HEAT repeat protein n=2 Tax=Ancylostoma ceylanicum TaxID=53326 RepID=A0A016S3E3_9BILA|nr:hypothetical protein Y032_0303g1878 [Ancylostoma ceylanicum]